MGKRLSALRNFKWIYPILLCLVTVIGCNKTADKVAFKKEVQSWGIDISGTTTEYDKPDTAYFRAIIMERIERGIDFTLSVLAIGNPSDRPPVIERFCIAPSVDPNEKPSIRDVQQAVIDSMKKLNMNLMEGYLIRIQKEIFELPQAKRTEKLSTDLTDVNGFLHKSQVLLREPTFMDSTCLKRLIAVTDCRQDLDNNKQPDAVVHELQKVAGLELYLVGCKDLKPFEGLHLIEFSGIDDLKIYFSNN